MFAMAVEEGIDYIVCGGDDRLAQLYRKMGFKPLGKPYYIERYGSLKHQVLAQSLPKLLSGWGAHPIYWSKGIKDVITIYPETTSGFNRLQRINKKFYQGIDTLFTMGALAMR